MNIKMLIKKAMLDSKIDSQKDLAVALGVSESYITKWKNDNKITDEYLSKLNALIKIDSHLPLHVKQIENHISERELEIIEAFRVLPKDRQDAFYYKVKYEAIEYGEQNGLKAV